MIIFGFEVSIGDAFDKQLRKSMEFGTFLCQRLGFLFSHRGFFILSHSFKRFCAVGSNEIQWQNTSECDLYYESIIFYDGMYFN